ncbi:MAG: response regulator [Candidatus Omnitrophica bacterium]|nr:response regulator [Candidatus Omnitrophota bacterium]
MAKKILIVDDELLILDLLQVRLEANKFEVIKATNGEEALEKAKGIPRPDLIVLDVLMPPPNGFQVCRTLKDDPDYRDIPIILLTAKSTESDKFWGTESGADAYITKPYSAEEFVTLIKSLIKK